MYVIHEVEFFLLMSSGNRDLCMSRSVAMIDIFCSCRFQLC